MLVSRKVLLCKIESTYNTDSSPAASTDAVLVSNLSWAHEGLRMIERNNVKPSLAGEQQLFAGTMMTFSFDMEIKGSGTAGVAPECGVPLRVCAMAETVVASTSVTYKPASTNHESATFYLYDDGRLIKLTGCRGTYTANYESGNVIMYSFTITGHSSAITDAALPTPTLDSTTPLAFKGASFAVGGYSSVINSLTFDVGNNVVTPPDVNASNGFGEVRITKRDANGSFDPEAVSVASNDYYGDFTGGSSLALATGTIGSTAGNRLATSMPAIYYRDISPGDRESISTYEIPYGAVESSGDDEISLVFT